MKRLILVFLLVLIIIISGCVNINNVDDENKCNKEPNTGPCKAMFTKYYFDQKEKICRSFIWGGCEGVVPFESLEKCKEICENTITKGDNFIQCEINKDTQKAFCIQVYDPVCGEDGKTYSNSCVACQSITKYKKGECK